MVSSAIGGMLISSTGGGGLFVVNRSGGGINFCHEVVPM